MGSTRESVCYYYVINTPPCLLVVFQVVFQTCLLFKHRLVKIPGECCEKCVEGTLPPTTTAPTTTPPSCGRQQFMCHVDGKCIPKNWECDGERDCYDASDERSCIGIKDNCFDTIGMYSFLQLEISQWSFGMFP